MILRIIATLLLSCSLATATATYSGKFVFPDSSGSVPGSASLTLKNCGGNFPLVSGVAINSNEPDIPLNSDGTWSKVLYRNDEISCNGSFTTVYTLIYKFNGRQVGPSRDYFCTQATCNLDSMTPVTTLPAPPAPQPPSSGARTFVFSQPIGSTTWTITHNLSVSDVIAAFYDLNSKQIYPDTVTETDPNTLTVTFVNPQAGRALIINVGNFTPTILNPNYIISNPTGSQAILGDFPFSIGGSLSAKRITVAPFLGPDPWFDVMAYGALGTGSGDDTTAINSANTAAVAANGCLYFPPLVFATAGTVNITASCVRGEGAMILYSGTGAAVQITNTFSSTLACDLSLPGVRRASTLWSSGSPSTDSGISILDANACNIKVPFIAKFTNGLNLSPSAFGVARNNFYLGQLNDNMRQILFAPTTSSGFVNQNNFFGGYFATDFALGWAVPGTRDILMSASTDQVTSNVFIGPDLEGQVSEYMIESWGAYNQIIAPEIENPISRTVTDATVTIGSATITLSASDVSAGKGFNTNADPGQTVTSTLFPGGTTILSVGSTTVATASVNATGSSVSNGTVTISSAPRVAYHNSGGNNAIQNWIYGGFPNSVIVVTKDSGVLSNVVFGAGKNGARYSILDGFDPGVGRGATVPWSVGTYGTGPAQWSSHPDSAAGDIGTEGGIAACGPNSTNNVCMKFFVDDTNTVWGLKMNGNVVSYKFVLNSGGTEFYRFDPSGGGTTTVGNSGGTVNVLGTFAFPTGGTSLVNRLRFSKATAQTSGNITLSAGWGNTASMSSTLGTDMGVALIVSSSGTGQAASPTVTITFADGTWTNSPICIAGAASGSTAIPTGLFISSVSATQVVIGAAGFTPTAGQTYGINLLCNGR